MMSKSRQRALQLGLFALVVIAILWAIFGGGEGRRDGVQGSTESSKQAEPRR